MNIKATLTALFFPFVVFAQQSRFDLTLLQSSILMIKNNHSLEIMDLSLKKTRLEKEKNNSLWYPSLNILGAYVHNSNEIEVRQSLDQLTSPLKDVISVAYPNDQIITDILTELGNQEFTVPLFKRNITSVDANIIWPIFTGCKRIYSSKISNRLVDIAQIDKQAVHSELLNKLVAVYYGLRLSKRISDVRLETYNTLKKHYSNALKLEENGMLNKADRLFAKVSVDEAKREYESSLKNLMVANNALITLLNIDTLNHVNPLTSLFINDDIPSLEYFKSIAGISNLAIKKTYQQENVADGMLKIEKSNYMPTISLIGKQTLFSDNLPKNLVPRSMIGIDLTWNIFDGFAREAEVKSAKINKQIVETSLKKIKSDNELAVDELYSKIKDAQDNVKALNTTIEMSKELLRVRKRSFQEGMATSTDVIDAETLCSKVKILYLSAYYQYDVSLASLLTLCGISEEFWKYKDVGKTVDFSFSN